MKTSAITLSLTLFFSATAASSVQAQQVTSTPGSANATTAIDGRYLPPPPQPFQGEIGLNALQSKSSVAGARSAAEGRAQHPADHHRRRWICGPVDVWWRHSDTDVGSHRPERVAIHELPYHIAVLADARRTDHRPQPPLGGLRRDLRSRRPDSLTTTASSPGGRRCCSATRQRLPPSIRAGT
jgi:hypothetical protein